MQKTQKKDFVGLEFSGYANGELFDSNKKEDLAKLDSKAEAKEIIVVIGEGMVVSGLDKALEGKDIGTEYEINVPAKEGFGERKRELVKTIPLKVFTEKNINPYPGLVLAMDDMMAKVITISGARVITDFNNPLSGKEIRYKFKITRLVTDETEKAKALFEAYFRGVPEFEIKDKITVKGNKLMEAYVKVFSNKFKDLVGKELAFELIEQKKEEKSDDKKE